MDYSVDFICTSHIGKCRITNQDNFICNGQYMESQNTGTESPLTGHISMKSAPCLFGVFDGMGGEECGEMAAFIAARSASNAVIGRDAIKDISQYCADANNEICKYAKDNAIGSMGTTAALLVFAENDIVMCNIGDSKVFRFAGRTITQISRDHVAISAYGTKPPLSQNLGIPPDELLIEPYIAQGRYHDKDIYLICSDGLTDMVAVGEIENILCDTAFESIPEKLLNTALANGGRDNISIIACKVVRNRRWPFNKR